MKKGLKKYLFRFLISFVFVSGIFIGSFSFGYQYEGLSEYQEIDGGISFECKEKCFVSLGDRDGTDYLNINGDISGTGSIIFFREKAGIKNFLYIYNLSDTGNNSITFSNYDKIKFDKLPKDISLGIKLYGNVKGNLKIDKISFPLSQKILKAWKDFWVMETFNYGGMNFRYGVSIGGRSIIEYGYITFILAVICILIISFISKKLDKRKILKSIFYVGLCLFLFVGFRNIITGTVLLKKGLSGFRTNYNLFELRDYIGFVIKVRDKLNLDDFEKNNCKIFIKNDSSGYNRAVTFHGEYFFEPCERVYSGYLADYIAYSGIELEAEDRDKDILVEYNGKYLLDNRVK